MIIPQKYQQVSADLCSENDKMKTFIENHFEITKNDEDRIHKDEFKAMYDTYYNCKFGWNTILTDIKRCRLNYEKEKRTSYNGLSLRGVIVGIKKKKRVFETITNHSDDNDDSDLDENDARYPDKLKLVTKERDEYKLKCEQLTKQLEELKKQLSQNNSTKSEPQPEIKKDTQSKKINLFDEVLKMAVEVEPKNKSKYAIVDKFNTCKAKQGKPEQKEIIV